MTWGAHPVVCRATRAVDPTPGRLPPLLTLRRYCWMAALGETKISMRFKCTTCVRPVNLCGTASRTGPYALEAKTSDFATNQDLGDQHVSTRYGVTKTLLWAAGVVGLAASCNTIADEWSA